MRHVDHHAATHDAIAELIKLGGFRTNPIFDGLDAFQIVKADLKRQFHIVGSLAVVKRRWLVVG